MKIWQRFNTDGCGVQASGLAGVMSSMIHAGVIRMRTDGSLVAT